MRITQQLQPNTIHSLVRDFQNLGVKKGMTLIVHSSMKSIGWICGGEVAVIEALMQAVGNEGTIVMPTQSAQLSDPSYWENPAVPVEWWDVIRKEMPAFDPKTTPTLGMGRIVECFRTYEGVERSSHPMASFAAWGKHRDYILREQSLSFSLGEHSPLQKLYNLEASILLIGVGYDNNTSLHLAEYKADSCFTCQQGSPILENGKRVWKEYEEYIYDVEYFPVIGKAYEEMNDISIGKVGQAECRLIQQRELVDFATDMLKVRKEQDLRDMFNFV